MPRVTIDDVAKKAGVSNMTVSRVINNKGRISDNTKARVQSVINDLGYRPSTIARSLSTNQTLTIGFMLPDIANPFFPDVVRGAEDLAWKNGYSIILCNTDEDQRRETQTLEFFEEKRVDGLILCSPRLPDKELLPLIKKHKSAVLYNRASLGQNTSSMQIDEDYGMTQVVEHLHSLGHKNIGFLTGPSHSDAGKKRVQAFKRALEIYSIDCDPAWLIPCAPDVQDAAERSEQLLESHKNLDALVCYNDVVAMGAIQTCRKLKRKIPDDIAITGVDDVQVAKLLHPSLTTLAVSKYDIGAKAVEMLLAQLNQKLEPQSLMLRPKLVIRGSTRSENL